MLSVLLAIAWSALRPALVPLRPGLGALKVLQAQNQNADAALALLDGIMKDAALDADDIERIEVACTTYCRDHVAWPYVPQGVASAQINMYYALSVMALDRAAMIEQFSEGRLDAPRILAFIPRISIAANPEFDALGNAYRYATRLCVITKSGARHERETRYRPGAPDSPISDDQLRAKFELLAGYALPPAAVERIAGTIATLPTTRTRNAAMSVRCGLAKPSTRRSVSRARPPRLA